MCVFGFCTFSLGSKNAQSKNRTDATINSESLLQLLSERLLLWDQQEAADAKQELGKFLTVLELAGPVVTMMLSSKSQLDTCEAIRALAFLHKYGFSFCKEAMKKMLTLIYSKEKNVQLAVIQCYRDLYFDAQVSIE